MRILFSVFLIVFLEGGLGSSLPSLGTTCPAADANGVSTFLIPSDSLVGPINLMLIKFDTKRRLPISSTVLHDQMNTVKTITRATVAEPFGPAAPTCTTLKVGTSQIDCSGGISMTDAQKLKATPRYTWDRGHLTPANPMRFSEDALNKTFYCVNIAPQDSWTNQKPWMIVETRSETKLKDTNGYVMTGVSSADNDVDGPKTYKGYNIPKSYWKLICYNDKVTSQPKVVGFIGDNSIVNFSDLVAQNARNATTFLPRSQSEILTLLTNPQLVSEGWTQAEENLLTGRQLPVSGVPTAQQCADALTISSDTLTEWQTYISA